MFLVAASAITQSAIVTGLAVLLLALCYAYSPRRYEIAGRTLVVNRLVGNVQIALDGVREARAATADDFRGCLRLWGSGGLFGYYGVFQTTAPWQGHLVPDESQQGGNRDDCDEDRIIQP